MTILVTNSNNKAVNLRMWGEAENTDKVKTLFDYLINNCGAFNLSSLKSYINMVNDGDGYLVDEIKCDKRDLILECPNDSILLDGLLGFSGIKWIIEQPIA